MSGNALLIIFLSLVTIGYASHFRGGTITWRPLNNTPSGTNVQIQVRQRYSWRRGVAPCTAAIIIAQGLIGDSSSVPCYTGTCTGWTSLNTQTACTDFSANLDVSSGEKIDLRTVNLGISFSIGFVSAAWFPNLVVGASGAWNLLTRINTVTRPDGLLNSSPVATTLPIIYKAIGVTHVHVVQMSDFDGTDVLKCRWSIGSTANFNSYNECGGVCNGVPSAVLFNNNCTLRFQLVTNAWYAAVALQIEDYYNTAAVTPMSSVSLQFLFYGYTTPGGCSAQPSIIGVRPNRACIGVDVGQNITEYVVVQVGCPGKTIIDFVSSTPIGMTKSGIQNPSTGIYQVVLSWFPTNAQRGPQGFCAGAVDNTNVQSDQWCITFLVGYKSPDIIRPMTVQGSASPLGTIMQTHTVFSIQTNLRVDRPTRNGTNIYFRDAATNAVVQQYDCGWAPEVSYTGFTIVIRFPVAPWIPGRSYYVTFDSGVASGTEFCGPESAPITDPSFWFFNIWNPALSSSGTNSTTPPTTVTVTTRAPSTTTPNTQMTTTGIVITTTTSPNISTTIITTTTTASTTTVTTASTTSTLPAVSVLNPKDMEKACEQPIIVATVVSLMTLAPIHALGMFAAFSKFSKMFNPLDIGAKIRRQQRVKRFDGH